MESIDRKHHWNDIYRQKRLHEVSWYQARPDISLQLIRHCHLPSTARIIDIGGGDSLLVDHLMDQGYENITVLDISGLSLERAITRLGPAGHAITWIESDVTHFRPAATYDLWHDRATFHFLTDQEEIRRYVETAHLALRQGGFLVVGTFSEDGPGMCSGLQVKPYTAESMATCFHPFFSRLESVTLDHRTTFDTLQNFVFCRFVRN